MTDETDNQQATEADIGWLAGIIDGEGHIGLSRQNTKKTRSVKVDLQIVNTDDLLIEKVIRIYRQLGVNPYVRQRVHIKATWATNTIVSLTKFAHVQRVLDAVLNHLTGVKRKKAILVLALIRSRMKKTRFDHYDAKELDIVERFMAMRIRKGASSTTRAARP